MFIFFEHNTGACSLQFNGLSSTLQNYSNDLIKCHCINLERQVCWWKRDIKPLKISVLCTNDKFFIWTFEKVVHLVSLISMQEKRRTKQSSLIGFRSLWEALCLRNRNVRHELLMGILKLFFKFLFLFFCVCSSTRFRVMAIPYGAMPSHSLETPQSVGLLWTTDQPDSKTPTWQHTTLKETKYTCLLRHSNPHFQQASGCRSTS